MKSFEEIKEELRKRVPGTTAVFLETKSEEMYLDISYKPLAINVKVAYCEDMDILQTNYINTLISTINTKIEFHKGTVTSLEYFLHCVESLRRNRNVL